MVLFYICYEFAVIHIFELPKNDFGDVNEVTMNMNMMMTRLITIKNSVAIKSNSNIIYHAIIGPNTTIIIMSRPFHIFLSR